MKNTTKYFLFAGLMASHLFGASVTAAPKNTSQFDGMVTRAEFVDRVCDMFQSLDKDRSGALEASESAKLPKWLGEIKANAKGTVSITNVVKAANAKFAAAAKTSTHFLTAGEDKALQAGR